MSCFEDDFASIAASDLLGDFESSVDGGEGLYTDVSDGVIPDNQVNVESRSKKQGRRWCITLNNPTPSEKEIFDEVFEASEGFVRYFVYQLERGESGTPHFQGYVEFNRQARWRRVKALFGGRCHVECARGSFKDNERYCTKEDGRLDGPFKFGEPGKNKQGQRNDLLAVKAKIDEGIPMKEIWDEYFSVCVKFHKGFDAYKLVKSKPRDFKTEVVVCYGPSGTGKSHYAFQKYPDAYWKQRGNWFDNYNDHDVVVVDEFYGWLPFDTLLRMCDKYPMMVEIKGGQVNFRPRVLVFTSNSRPDEWYKAVPNLAALIRRIDRVLYFYEGFSEPEEYVVYEEFKNRVCNARLDTFI